MGKTSSEVKNAWKQRNYKQYNVAFRYDTDGDLIEYIESQKSDGKNTTEIFRAAVKKLKEDYESVRF